MTKDEIFHHSMKGNRLKKTHKIVGLSYIISAILSRYIALVELDLPSLIK